MEILWASWRSAYVRTADEVNAADGCLFCRLPGAGDDEAMLITDRGPHGFAVLNRFPYTTGHLMVSPYRHIAGIGEATPDEAADLWRLLTRAEAAVSGAMAPSGFNLGANLGRIAGAGVGVLMILAAGVLGNYANAVLFEYNHLSVGASTSVFGAVGITAAYQFTAS